MAVTLAELVEGLGRADANKVVTPGFGEVVLIDEGQVVFAFEKHAQVVSMRFNAEKLLSAHYHKRGCWSGETHDFQRVNPKAVVKVWDKNLPLPPWELTEEQLRYWAGSRPKPEKAADAAKPEGSCKQDKPIESRESLHALHRHGIGLVHRAEWEGTKTTVWVEVSGKLYKGEVKETDSVPGCQHFKLKKSEG